MADNGTINDQFAEQFKPMSDAFQSALELMLSSILGRRAGIKRKKIGSLDFRDVKEIVSEKVVFLTAQAIKGLRGYVCVIIKGNIVNKIVDELFSGKKGINDILPGDVKETKEHLADRFFQDLAEKLHSAFSGEFSFGQGHWEVLEKGWDIPALFGEDEALAQVVYQGAAKGDNAMEAYVWSNREYFYHWCIPKPTAPG